MLVPEIALTPQTVDRFLSRFPGQVGLMHSKLSDGERYDTWRRARLGASEGDHWPAQRAVRAAASARTDRGG